MIHSKSTDEPSWLVRARRELGVHEIVGATHNPRVLQYHQATRLKAATDEVAWCAAFVCWCLEGEGVVSTRSAAAASYATYGRASLLNPGAIIVFGKHDPDAKGSGHVGFVNAPAVGDWVEVISGNCNNAVRLKQYRWADAVAVRWPTF
jgi:uncharacterized protein (TIGR02594 family)